MKKLIVGIFMVMVMVVVISCGAAEKIYDRQNYESLTNEYGNIELYSGGVLVKEFKDVQILYSSSDTFALWVIKKNGKKFYWQGEAYVDLRD